MSGFASFRKFYPFYLGEQSNRICRRVHFVGTALVLATIGFALAMRDVRWLWFAPVFGYGFAWIGHLVFEWHRPPTFSHPTYSLAGDRVMFADVLHGRVRI